MEFTPEEKALVLELLAQVNIKVTQPNAAEVLAICQSIQAKLTAEQLAKA